MKRRIGGRVEKWRGGRSLNRNGDWTLQGKGCPPLASALGRGLRGVEEGARAGTSNDFRQAKLPRMVHDGRRAAAEEQPRRRKWREESAKRSSSRLLPSSLHRGSIGSRQGQEEHWRSQRLRAVAEGKSDAAAKRSCQRVPGSIVVLPYLAAQTDVSSSRCLVIGLFLAGATSTKTTPGSNSTEATPP